MHDLLSRSPCLRLPACLTRAIAHLGYQRERASTWSEAKMQASFVSSNRTSSLRVLEGRYTTSIRILDLDYIHPLQAGHHRGHSAGEARESNKEICSESESEVVVSGQAGEAAKTGGDVRQASVCLETNRDQRQLLNSTSEFAQRSLNFRS